MKYKVGDTLSLEHVDLVVFVDQIEEILQEESYNVDGIIKTIERLEARVVEIVEDDEPYYIMEIDYKFEMPISSAVFEDEIDE